MKIKVEKIEMVSGKRRYYIEVPYLALEAIGWKEGDVLILDVDMVRPIITLHKEDLK